ncbi:UDP-N-acetylenolpyruvoylglucosamine reductase [unidentified eubacterium SCB49]|nr:UDP-N-acetylenolpyruvoylglucosamine reductase [unidentified eubacterium SCB49]
MQISHNISLKQHNTFGIDVTAETFYHITTVAQLKKVLSEQKNNALFILGGGSNMLLTQDIKKPVLHIDLKGIEVISETDDNIIIKASAGENWHQFIIHCIHNNYGGLENMSLIPGNVGTAPIQNIGAYGVELKDCFYSCEAIDVNTQETHTFTNKECEFGYRNSIFKNQLKGQFIITSVSFSLTKRNHKLRTGYGAIQEALNANNISTPTIKDISEAVIAIRQSKLPDPNKLGNSGSFFKNPIIDLDGFRTFQQQFPEAPFYKITETQFKIPAGWLIEQAGFKGKRYGDAGVHKNQALVLVNYGNATGQEIWDLAMKVKEAVIKKFGITIAPEVNVF